MTTDNFTADFTRSTFNKTKHYTKVNMQQGKVTLDADWNEQQAIDAHHLRAELVDDSGNATLLKCQADKSGKTLEIELPQNDSGGIYEVTFEKDANKTIVRLKKTKSKKHG
jgi:hypothetical protein